MPAYENSPIWFIPPEERYQWVPNYIINELAYNPSTGRTMFTTGNGEEIFIDTRTNSPVKYHNLVRFTSDPETVIAEASLPEVIVEARPSAYQRDIAALAGTQRVQGVNNAWKSNPELMQHFKDANDAVGYAASLVLTLPTGITNAKAASLLVSSLFAAGFTAEMIRNLEIPRLVSMPREQLEGFVIQRAEAVDDGTTNPDPAGGGEGAVTNPAGGNTAAVAGTTVVNPPNPDPDDSEEDDNNSSSTDPGIFDTKPGKFAQALFWNTKNNTPWLPKWGRQLLNTGRVAYEVLPETFDIIGNVSAGNKEWDWTLTNALPGPINIAPRLFNYLGDVYQNESSGVTTPKPSEQTDSATITVSGQPDASLLMTEEQIDSARRAQNQSARPKPKQR